MEMPTILTELSLANPVDAETIENQNNQGLRYGFSIGSLNFVYDASIACELVKGATIYPIPNTPTWMLGLINLRGNLIPVFNLENYFNFKEQADEHNLLLVLGKDDKAVAFQLKKYPQLLQNLTQLNTLPKLIPKLEGCVLNAYQAQTIWLELDKEQFFTRLGENVCI
jgi:twitching motility protein PilI